MAQLIGLARVGRDVELRYTGNGDAVSNVSLAFNYGRKGEDGKRPTQWVDASLWNKRAEALTEYLLSGTQVFVVIDDVHIETYETRDGGTGSKMVGTISSLEFASSGNRDGQQGGGQHQQGGGQQRGNGGGQQRQQGNQGGRGGYGGGQQGGAPRQGQQRQAPQQRQSQGGGGGHDPFDDDSDIPFVSSSFAFDVESKLDRRVRRANRTRHD